MSEINFKDLQEQTGLSVRKLAEAADTNRMVVQRWLNGDPPSVELQTYAIESLRKYCAKQIKLHQQINRDLNLVTVSSQKRGY